MPLGFLIYDQRVLAFFNPVQTRKGLIKGWNDLFQTISDLGLVRLKSKSFGFTEEVNKIVKPFKVGKGAVIFIGLLLTSKTLSSKSRSELSLHYR